MSTSSSSMTSLRFAFAFAFFFTRAIWPNLIKSSVFFDVCGPLLFSRKFDKLAGVIEDSVEQLLYFCFPLAEAAWGCKGLVGPSDDPNVVRFYDALNVLRILHCGVLVAGDCNW